MRFKVNSFKPKYYIAVPIIAVLLAGIGILFIYSASNYSAEINYNDAFFYVKKQAMALLVGVIFMIIGTKIKIEFLAKIKWIILAVSIVFLALVFIPGLGSESYGATRWIDLKIITIQPSEPAKFGFMIFLAAYMAEKPPVKIKYAVIPILTGGIICGLIMAEPNMSITVVVGLSLLVMLFVGGLNKKLMVCLGLLVIAAGVLLIVLEPYRMERLTAFLDPWKNPKDEGYQLIQSYYALGSGDIFGVGLFQSRQKYLFLPFAESDFIFSVIGEETGVIGCLLIIFLFTAYIFSGIKIARKGDSPYAAFLATGLVSITAIQSVVNMAVVSGSIPPTGVPLPFVSFGGTSLVTFLFVSGLLYNIGRNHSV